MKTKHMFEFTTASMQGIVGTARKLRLSTGGNVAMIVALAMIPMLGFVGFALDYSRALSAKSSLASTADTAVLAALSPRNINSNLSQSAQDAASTAAALAVMNGVPLPFGTTLGSVNATISRPAGSNAVTMTLAYNATINTTLTNIFGLQSMAIGGTASAASAGMRYIDIYVLVDSSTSMGIGASPADQNIMQNTPGMDGGTGGCVVACHQSNTDALARSNGATLRFDVVKNAVGTMVNQAQALTGSQIRFGVYSFANAFKTEIDITTNMTAVTAAVNAMTLSKFDGGTNVANALNALKLKIPAGGDGSSAASPLTFVLLMTDGTGNAVDNQSNGNWTYSPNFVVYNPHSIADAANDPTMDLEGLNPAWCSQFKTANINVMTLETQYVIPAGMVGNELRFTYINNTIKPQMTANMQACASSAAYAFSANLPADIQTAIQRMFQTATTIKPRLVN